METKVFKSASQVRLDEENRILKEIDKEIKKSAKKGDFHYYWDISGLSQFMVKSVVEKIESQPGRFVNSKGTNFKIIRW
jgi:hypothetical protein